MIGKKHKSLLLLLVILVRSSDAATIIPEDESFTQFCANIGGTMSKKAPVKNIVTQGAQCKNAHFGGILANDKEEAKQICKHYSPFYMTDANIDNQGFITCNYEALLICRTGFKQINGRCYRIENGGKSALFVQAQQICSSADLKLYQHRDERTAGFIGLLFKDLSSIWAVVDETGVLFDISHDSGPQYAIVYGIASLFNVVRNSLIKIPNDNYAMVVCEYTPVDTIMLLRAKVKMLSKYIYPAVVENDLSVWRTYSHHLPTIMRIYDANFEEHQVYCKRSMSALIDPKNVRLFDPKKGPMKKLGGQLKHDALFFSPFRYSDYYEDRNVYISWCSASIAWTDNKKIKVNCEHSRSLSAGSYHAYDLPTETSVGWELTLEYKNEAVMMPYQSNGQYTFWPLHARPAPMLCDVMFNGIGVYEPCPSGWLEYVRPDGSRACHLYHTQKMKRDEARQYCADKYKATLAGVHHQYELILITKFGVGWFSLKKASWCRYMSKNEGDPCFKHKAFYDPDYASNQWGIQNIADTLGSDQPEGSAEYCMVWNGSDHFFHDWGCDALWPFTCTLVTKQKIGEIDYNGKANA